MFTRLIANEGGEVYFYLIAKDRENEDHKAKWSNLLINFLGSEIDQIRLIIGCILMPQSTLLCHRKVTIDDSRSQTTEARFLRSSVLSNLWSQATTSDQISLFSFKQIVCNVLWWKQPMYKRIQQNIMIAWLNQLWRGETLVGQGEARMRGGVGGGVNGHFCLFVAINC